MNYPFTNPYQGWSQTVLEREILRIRGEGNRIHFIPTDKIECVSERQGGGTLINCTGNCYVVPDVSVLEVATLLGWVKTHE